MGHRAIRNRFLIAFAALLAMLPAQAHAWGEFAHRTTAEIALENIRPETRAAIAELLKAAPELGEPDCELSSLEDAAVWPDCLRKDYWRWGYTFAWHYRTTPVCEAYEPRKNCSGQNCILAQIERNQRILADEDLPANVRLEALAFLVHFIGDVHMPLHSGDHEDRGGNDIETDYGIAPGLNLHWIWDGPLAERAITSAEVPLVRRYTAEERAELGGGTPADWGRESWQTSRDFVYPNAFDRPPCDEGELPDETALTQEDIERAIPISQRRVTQAGIRMAEYLDAAFAPGPLPEPERN
ncbi:S1/P1 nuclease [Qipengyuania gelatinilytica]|uniref:S1/P1 nuclease n=1 Tax=Qipengyuania gelatinilytica TaxID=2867231 RepID=A0ABX9A5L4_9SPHN|nr:S1/P1 nuclease [Qipengyuania gelatinilytica]QZD96312.1 S1/P1 nuclease [Qipengyuania gelatinilytica]